MEPIEKLKPESTPMITPSEIIEHIFCPRFTFFMNVLCIPQHEEQRYKVSMGRQLHDKREKENRDYLRKKIGCTHKEISIYLASPTIRVRGIVDEVLFFDDRSASPLDYKFAEYRDFLFETHKVQSTLYAMLIKEIYKSPVYRGYICYVRNGSQFIEIVYEEKDYKHALEVVDEIFKIIEKGYYPKATKWKNRCIDCCYRNICV